MLLNVGWSHWAPVCLWVAFRLYKSETEETLSIQDGQCEEGRGAGHLPTPAIAAAGVKADSRRIAIRPDLTKSDTVLYSSASPQG